MIEQPPLFESDEGKDDEREYQPPQRPGRYSGNDATETERESGAAVEKREVGKLRKGGAGHQVLRVYADNEARSSYEASYIACGSYHGRRRESTRLVERGLLEKWGTTRNPDPMGRDHVDAYRITSAGRRELVRLG